MPLYQPSVLNQELKLLDKIALEKAYKKYTLYFLNPIIQDNIRASKEEEYQGIFLTELFANIFDYTLKPNANFNLVAEYKNETNSRKADGAILLNDNAIGVIELKGTNTKDLESIRKQAFDYKANQKGCVYVITSNFEKLRFYINDATEFEEFNLFELTKERFELLYLCLQKDNVLNHVPLRTKEASIVVEEQITKQFYKDYSLFKRELYRDLVKRNAKRLKTSSTQITSSDILSEEQKQEVARLEKNVKLRLFKKSQKLIDRFLFIFFAEDRGLLPPNSTRQILDKWRADIDFGDERPLYDLFKQYFKFLDIGRQGTKSRAEIYAYNGGLFKEDSVLDALEIDNELLYKYTFQLANYDFESQVDVNILGHIFENSLNEIESVNAEIQGDVFDKQKSKRKKDGVFYTPKYITKFIVENTVGKLCEEKKSELGFKEEEYFKGRKNRNKTTITKLIAVLDNYREWLLKLTICDPACGSGAFLNQALDFLIKEHTYIDELKTKVLGGGFQFPDIENTILENNIFGVDLNEESVEIAKLSLWLRTAQPKRKLNDLSSNIKCGNSLIESKEVAGGKAFNWQAQFPKVFENGGFNIVIGNPPYGALLKGKTEYNKKYNFKSSSDSYQMFCILAKDILNPIGICGFIIPNSWMNRKGGREFRSKLDIFELQIVIDFQNQVFEDANIDTCIIIYSHRTNENNTIFASKIEYPEQILTDLDYNEISFLKWKEYDKFNTEFTNDLFKIFDKLYNNSKKLEELTLITGGYKPYQVGYGKSLKGDFPQTKEDVKNWVYHSSKKIDSTYYPDIKGGNILRYYIKPNTQWVKWGKWLMSPKKIEDFLNPKIVVREVTGEKLNASFDDSGLFTNDTTHMIREASTENLKYYLAILNSSLIGWYFRTFYGESNTLFPKIKVNELKDIPIKIIPKENQIKLTSKVDFIIRTFASFHLLLNELTNYLNKRYTLTKVSNKLQNWQELEFSDFIKELNKAIKKTNKESLNEGFREIAVLTKKDEFEWLDLFEEKKQKAQELQNQINQTDKEIDSMVYDLYGLTDEEIRIVES